MKLPLSLSELSIFRSIARLMIPIGGLALVLWGIYTMSGMFLKMMNRPDAETPVTETPNSFSDRLNRELGVTEEGLASFRKSLRTFPHETTIESADGRILAVELLERTDSNEIVFRRLRDGARFRLGLERLSPKTRDFVEGFSTGTDSSPEFEAPPVPDPHFLFPYNCKLTSHGGRTLDVTLLGRPDDDLVTFRRRHDQKVFTINLDGLQTADQSFIRQFSAFPR